MATESQFNQLNPEGDANRQHLHELRRRWGERAGGWNASIQEVTHYTAETYRRFNAFAEATFARLPRAANGIDIGCGTAEATKPLAQKVNNLYLLDIAEEMVRIAHRKYPHAYSMCASATDIPLPSGSMDYSISRGIVVSHLGPQLSGRFLDELTRVTRSQGVVLFDFLNDPKVNPSTLSAPKALFTLDQMRQELQNRNYSEIRFDGDDSMREVRVTAVKQ